MAAKKRDFGSWKQGMEEEEAKEAILLLNEWGRASGELRASECARET